MGHCAGVGGLRVQVGSAGERGEGDDEPVAVAADSESEHRSPGGLPSERPGRTLCHDDFERNAFLLEAGRQSRRRSCLREECENERLPQRAPP